VHKVKLISSSGVSIADDAATQAINDAAPFANLPDGVGDEIDINFTFDYNVFGRGR
jgi:TonB family protein